MPLFPATIVESIGLIGAALTTLCWLPQALKSMRERNTRSTSLLSTATFAFGVACWLIYGVAKEDVPLTLSSAVTLALMLVILALKIRYG